MSDPPGGAALSEFRTRRRVEFADTDLGGIVHFARFFVFMETAEHEFLRALGTEVHARVDGREIGWPRVAASCEYLSPARFGDELEIRLRVARKGRRSMSYAVTFHRGETLLARGTISSVCCLMDGAEGLEAIAIPEPLASRIAEAGPD